MPKRSTLTLLVVAIGLVACYRSVAQEDSTVVRFYIPSQFFIIKIRDNIFENRKIVKIPQGLHRIQIYTPEFEFVDTLIFIENNPDGQIITPVFKLSKEFDKYISDLREYREKNFKEVGVPLIVTAFSMGFTAYYYGKAYLSFDNASYTYRKWLGANANERQAYLDEFERHFADYKHYRNMNYLSLALTAVSSAFAIRGIIRYYRRKTPSFKLPVIPFEEYDLRIEPLSYDLLYPGFKIIVPF